MPELLVVSAILLVIMAVSALPIAVTLIVIDAIVGVVLFRHVMRQFSTYPPPRWILHLKFYRARFDTWLRFRKRRS